MYEQQDNHVFKYKVFLSIVYSLEGMIERMRPNWSHPEMHPNRCKSCRRQVAKALVSKEGDCPQCQDTINRR